MFKVLTYNVHMWAGRDGRMDVERLATIIESTGADVVALNEVLHPVHTHYSQTSPVADLANLLRMDWAFGESNRTVQHAGWWGPVGNAVLSRHPIAADANHYLPKLPGTQGRSLLAAHIDVAPDRQFTVFSTHLDHAFEGTRMWQLRGLLTTMQPHAAEPHVLMGDFNTPGPVGPRSKRLTPPVVRMLKGNGYVDAFMTAGLGNHATFPMTFPLRIDFIFVPEVLKPKLTSCQVVNGPLVDKASDHRPLMAEFDWN